MIETEVSFTSLCYISEDYDGKIWLNRLADIEDGKLHTPFKSNRSDNYFENRDRLYQNDGPTAIGTVGVWDWTAIPNRNKPDTDYVQTFFVQDESPVRVVVVQADSLDLLVEQLKNGSVYSKPFICDTLFCYEPLWGQLTGVLCKSGEFQIANKCIKLKDDICTLPCYTIHTSEIFNWEDKHLRFLRNLNIGEPNGHFLIGNTQEVVRSIILDRITWPLFKESVGATKTEWRNSKTLLERISGDTLYDVVANKLKCTTEQAKQAVDNFISSACTNIDVGDIDADVLAQLAMNHEGLRSLCEEAISENWVKNHAVEIARAEAEIAAKKSDAELELSAMSLHLADIEKEQAAVQENRDALLSEIDNAQEKLNHLLAEINQYEELGTETLVAVKKKIAEAQKDMAGFIADLSIFMPQATAAPPSRNTANTWKYECAKDGPYSEDDIELAHTWDEEYNALSQNLSNSIRIEPTFGAMLAAFLYSAHINNIPLLVAGPGGAEIANALSVSLYAKDAGHLTLGNEYDCDVVDEIKKNSEQIISIDNMFGKGWSDTLPQAFSQFNMQVIWTHPTVEDLVIEPKGLYNYMLPILSESFIGMLPAQTLWPGKRLQDDFKAFVSPTQKPLKLSAFKRLGLSKLIQNRLSLVLSDAKELLGTPSADKDIEILMGLLPLCVVTGRIDILREVIESENGISSAVKAEAARYFEEE